MSRRQIIRIIFVEAFVISAVGLVLGMLLGHGISILVFAIFKRVLKLSAYYRIRLIPEAIALSALAVFVATFYSMVSPVEKLYKLNPIRALKMSDEYENRDKKLKANRGRLLTRLFGVETGYAYKNTLRNKKRFLLIITTLTVWTILASTVFTIISIAKKAMYDMLVPKCDYDGFIDTFDGYSADKLKASLEDIDEVTCVTRMDAMFISDMDNDYISYLGYGFSEEEFRELASISEGYNSEYGTYGVLVYDNNEHKAGDIFYGDTKVLGVFTDEEGLLEAFRKYQPWDTSFLSRNNIFVYNIDNDEFMDDVNVNGGSTGLLIEFKDGTKHPEFDKYIDGTPYYFDDYFYEYNIYMDGLTVVKTGIITFLILVFILYMINTVNTNSSEMLLRKKELNILRTIGMSKKQVDKMLYLEGIIVSLIAAVIGNIIGSLAGNGIFNLFMIAGREEGEPAELVIHFDIPAILFITVMLIIINMFAVWITKPEEEEIILN